MPGLLGALCLDRVLGFVVPSRPSWECAPWDGRTCFWGWEGLGQSVGAYGNGCEMQRPPRACLVVSSRQEMLEERFTRMTIGQWLLLVGGMFLCLGLGSVIWASRYEARLVVAGLVLNPETPQGTAQRAMRQRADRLFRGAVLFMAIGMVLQIFGSLF